MASLTLTIPDAQVDRVLEAFADRVGKDPADVVAEDVRQELLMLVKLIVRQYEKEVAATAAEAGVSDVDVT